MSSSSSTSELLEMREAVLQVNQESKNTLSKDLGALTGLLFDIGVDKVIVDENAQFVLEKERKLRLET
ncbi:MAG: hypothetical protein M1548_02060 [Actinobacteria bacterium]|nr:hypothetical protein [Actinomycetota bacterium]